MSLREKVSLHRWHMYGRSPVSVSESKNKSQLQIFAKSVSDKGLELTSEEMSLEVLGVEIGLITVRTRVFTVSIFLWNHAF